jgi:hypothetical protein
MQYKTLEAYKDGLAVANMCGAGHLFKQKNSYKGQPREERLAHGHKLAQAGPKLPKDAPLSPEQVEEMYHISEFTGPRDFALLAQVDWAKPYFGAKPYLDAMLTMSTFNACYGLDSAQSICQYFLANASTWRGPVARLAKAKLTALLDAA